MVVINKIGGGGGGSFTSPMANDTFLEGYLSDGTTAEELIGVASDDNVVMGSISQGRAVILLSSDQSTFSSTHTLESNNSTIHLNDLGSDSFQQYLRRSTKTIEYTASNSGDPMVGGIILDFIVDSGVPAQGLVTVRNAKGNSDALNQVVYFTELVRAKDVIDGNESTEVEWTVKFEGADYTPMALYKGRLSLERMAQFRGESVTGGTAYGLYETGFNTQAYAYEKGLGTTVPADATADWLNGAIFNDTDATPDSVLRTFINQGTAASSAFRAIATYKANSEIMTPTGQLIVPAGSTSLAGITFTGAGVNTGIYSTGANSLDITIAGTRRWSFQSNTIRGVAGSASVPNLTTIADPDTGVFVGTGTVGTTIDGTSVHSSSSAGGLLLNNRIQGKQGTSVAIGTTITLGSGNAFEITGTGGTLTYMTITDWQDGSEVTLYFTGASNTITHNGGSPSGTSAAFLLTGAANLTVNGTTAIKFQKISGKWVQVSNPQKVI